MKKIFYAEDDAAIARSVQEYLLQQDYEVDIFPTAARTRQALLSETPDLILVDWNLPDENGDGLCRWIRRRWESLPVIFLTVRNDAADVISGFETGADDYVTKPFDLEILASRIRALLRRAGRTAGAEGERARLRCGEILLDTGKKTAFIDQEEIALSRYQSYVRLYEQALARKSWQSNQKH